MVQQGCDLNVTLSDSLLKRRLSFDTNILKISNANMSFDSARFVRFKPHKSPAECVDGLLSCTTTESLLKLLTAQTLKANTAPTKVVTKNSLMST